MQAKATCALRWALCCAAASRACKICKLLRARARSLHTLVCEHQSGAHLLAACEPTKHILKLYAGSLGASPLCSSAGSVCTRALAKSGNEAQCVQRSCRRACQLLSLYVNFLTAVHAMSRVRSCNGANAPFESAGLSEPHVTADVRRQG